MTKGNEDYEIGYRKPPRHSRWQKGQSGNKSGRAKAPKRVDFLQLLKKAINKRVKVRIGGDIAYLTKLEAGAEQIANKYASGDLRTIKMVLPLLDQLQSRSEDKYVEVDVADAKNRLRDMLGLPPKPKTT
jgi:hypothetical protein